MGVRKRVDYHGVRKRVDYHGGQEAGGLPWGSGSGCSRLYNPWFNIFSVLIQITKFVNASRCYKSINLTLLNTLLELKFKKVLRFSFFIY